MKITTIIVAAGSSTRMGGDIPKPYLLLRGKPVLRHSVDAFATYFFPPPVGEDQGGGSVLNQPHPNPPLKREGRQHHIIVAINPDHLDLFDAASTGAPWVSGGATRQDSVRLALESLADAPPDYVLIHDAARPFVSTALIKRVATALEHHTAVIPAIAVVDTIRHTDGHTLNRDDLRAAQTPQGFRYAEILAAHRLAAVQSLTDDAAVMEAAGHNIFLVEGEVENRKLTTAPDWAMATQKGENSMRIGQGYDVHRLIENPARPLMICGVEIPSPLALDGHSDADVGLHALVDAILGAIGQGDIGQHFPPSDAKWKNVKSSAFVAHAMELMKAHGFSIGNADITIICEQPKITPHRDAMRARVAALLEVDASLVNIKATTTEGLGFTGRGEGIAAQAVVMVTL